MLKYCPAPLGGVVLLMLALLAGFARAQSVTVPADPLGAGAMPVMPAGDDASGIILTETSARTAAADTAAGDTSMYVLAGLRVASSELEFSPMLQPMLDLYSQLLAIDGQAVSPISLQRLQARLAGGAETSLLHLDEVLAVDLARVELLPLSRDHMARIGLDQAAIARLPALPSLIDDLRVAMLNMPAGLAEITQPVALAVWGRESGQPMVALLLLAAS